MPVIIQFGGGAFPLADGVAAPPNPCAPPGGFGARGAAPGGGGSPRPLAAAAVAGRGPAGAAAGPDLAAAGAREGVGLRQPQHRQRPG